MTPLRLKAGSGKHSSGESARSDSPLPSNMGMLLGFEKKRSWPLTVFILLSLFFLAPSCSQRETEEAKQIEARRQELRRSVLGMMSRTGAVSEWTNTAHDISGRRKLFTSDFQELLIRADHRPVLFSGMLEDVEKRDQKYYARFRNFDKLGIPLAFVLECNPDLAAKLTNQKAAYFGVYVVVAEISEVTSQTAEKPSGANEDDSAPSTTAHGRCVDFLDSELFDVNDLIKQ